MLIIEEEIIPCGTDPVHSFVVLLASFFAFHVHYPTILKPWFNFIEHFVLNISMKKQIDTSAAQYYNMLENIVDIDESVSS